MKLAGAIAFVAWFCTVVGYGLYELYLDAGLFLTLLALPPAVVFFAFLNWVLLVCVDTMFDGRILDRY